jgi:hypothetical protein
VNVLLLLDTHYHYLRRLSCALSKTDLSTGGLTDRTRVAGTSLTNSVAFQGDDDEMMLGRPGNTLASGLRFPTGETHNTRLDISGGDSVKLGNESADGGCLPQRRVEADDRDRCRWICSYRAGSSG